MANRSNLQVTFSKRRAGLFKKASELCTLCGSEAAMVVFSPADKPYCFGHPNAKTVFDRFMKTESEHDADHNDNSMLPNDATRLIMEAHRNSNIRELNLELTQLESMLRVERHHGEEIDAIRKAGVRQRWFPGTFDEFDYNQLGMLKEAIMGFKNSFDEKMRNRINYAPYVNNCAIPIGYVGESSNSKPNPNPDQPSSSSEHDGCGWSG
ncbi:agamous-like MADS-box protein AGL62 [Andrographis paniculata]|uniref:agamous-like MADS-box protein AGL62 n=1 Tax=Andrographis paniculata TaxID=175694 RepID=UPI0021E88B2B|nr:agamous-like MADS-box protein AGL62 [Andrographis paniculata]